MCIRDRCLERFQLQILNFKTIPDFFLHQLLDTPHHMVEMQNELSDFIFSLAVEADLHVSILYLLAFVSPW